MIIESEKMSKVNSNNVSKSIATSKDLLTYENVATVDATNKEKTNIEASVKEEIKENTKDNVVKANSNELTNEYVKVLNARYERAKNNNVSNSNAKKLERLLLLLSKSNLYELLRVNKVDATIFNRAIYAIEKIIKFALQAVEFNDRDVNENTFAIFRTAVNCAKNNKVFTKKDACAAISKDFNIEDEEKKNLIHQRNIIQVQSTIAAQTQTSLAALEALNIIKKSNERRDAYVVNLDKDITKKLCHNFNIDLEMKAA